ncbi:purine and uridine phosphorylase, partial [Trichodelitschia bisporula]
RLKHSQYTIGWICALPIEHKAARGMLDEEHPSLPQNPSDDNVYTLGRIGEHNTVIVGLPAGLMGTSTAAWAASKMQATFSSIRFGLMVGIGGGVPSCKNDIRLGDVVVSQPSNGHGGVIQYDFGKTTPDKFERTGFLNSPPIVLLNAVANLRANYDLGGKILCHLTQLSRQPLFARENAGPDVLYRADYNHERPGTSDCSECKTDFIKRRQPRGNDFVIHYGTIASGNQVVRDATTRDRLSKDFGGVLCFEMEAAGLMNHFPCLVVRGVCDYADSHKNKSWQPYAAVTAAAYAKEILLSIPAAEVETGSSAVEVMKQNLGKWLLPFYDGSCHTVWKRGLTAVVRIQSGPR